jgi:anti-sigma factor RsiW
MTAPVPVDPAELSALIDGELPPERAGEVEARLAQDPALRAEYEALRANDARWRQAAGAATFVPTINLGRTREVPLPWLAAIVLVLLAARLGGKFIGGLGPSMLLNLAALVVVGWAVLAAARHTGPAISARRV